MKILATLLATIACALPAAAQYDETAKSFHLLPHLADGGGWQSVLLVTNVSQSASRCTFNVYGVPLNRFTELGSFGTAAGSTATFQLASRGGYLTWPTKNELAAVESGYATLDCSSPVVAQVVFASFDGLGVTAAATVFSAQVATVFQFLVSAAPAGSWRQSQYRSIPRLGFAIANDTNAGASCRIVLEDYQRTNLGEATLSVPAKSNRAQLLNDVIAIPGTFFGGTATVSCNQPVAIIGLHFELRDGTIITFSTLPPAILSAIPADTGDHPGSRPNIERFRGTWQFTYTKDRAAITDTFRLNVITERSDEPDEWLIGGIQDDGEIAVLFYRRDSDNYVLATAAAGTPDEIEALYSFNLTSPTTVSGCYYEILSSTSISSCYPMTGVRTSFSTLSSVKRAQPNTTAAHAELGEIEEAAGELGNEVQIEVVPKIIRVLEDLREVLRQ